MRWGRLQAAQVPCSSLGACNLQAFGTEQSFSEGGAAGPAEPAGHAGAALPGRSRRPRPRAPAPFLGASPLPQPPSAVSGPAIGIGQAPGAASPPVKSPSLPPAAPVLPAAASPALIETLNVLVSLLENARADLRGHSSMVARLTRKTCERIGLSPLQIAAFTAAAYLRTTSARWAPTT